MTDLKDLEKKVKEIEERVKKLEDQAVTGVDTQEKETLDMLYNQAKELVIKNNNASIAFLQRKLWVDFPRAKKILAQLEKEGVIGPATGVVPRKVLVEK